MATSDFRTRLETVLKHNGDGSDYRKTYEALKRIVDAIASSLNGNAGREKLRILLEPGFLSDQGQQLNVVVAIPTIQYRDVLFRAYVPVGGYPTYLDLYGEELLPCEGEMDLENRILAFLARPEVRERLHILQDTAAQA
jgi:hypothetical protein